MKLIGNGGIRQLSAKKWECWQFVEIDGERKQRTTTITGGKKDARDGLRDFQNKLADQLPPSDSFAAYAASWLAWKRDSGAYSPSTIRSYECAIKKLNFGNKPMSEITPQDCRETLSKATSGLSGTSSSFVYTITKMVFNSAVKEHVILYNPLDNINKPKIDTKERQALSPDNLDMLWKNLETLPLDGKVMMMFFCIDAGLRIGEATTLETKDVHTDSFKVSHSKTTKRTLPLTPRLKAKCREWEKMREMRGISDAPTYCCKPNGLTYQGFNLWKWYREEICPLGAPEHIHDLRHSNLSRMARYLSTYDLQRWAGWNSAEMAKRYVHDDYSQLEAAAANVG